MSTGINSYHVLGLVGEGSFGRVYKGRKKFSGQVVALKFIPKVDRSEKELQGLKREIDIMRGLQHPHIVQMFDSFETDREVVVVTEYAEGDLFQILEDDGNLAENQVCEIACQLVSALYYLHSHRILHRDMKPQNILLGKGGVVKLCDFGFARAMSVSTLVLTSIKGTPLYMSPELVSEKPYDHTADLWSLGCILYELHTGVPPFYTNSIFHLAQLIVRNPVKWPQGGMSRACTSFLKGLLTKDPQKRLSWPELLHHPFIADRVLMLSSPGSLSPLTVAPSPDVQALKRQQVVEKTVPHSGESKLLRKARQLRNNDKESKQWWKCERGSSPPARAAPPPSVTASHLDQHMVRATANRNPRNEPRGKSKVRSQISRDYEREFPSVEVGPQLVQTTRKESRGTAPNQDDDEEDEWETLVHETDPRQQNKPDHQTIIPLLHSKLLACQSQLSDGSVEGALQIVQPLKVLRNLLLTSGPQQFHPTACDLGLPHLLFSLVHGIVENPASDEQSWGVTALGEIMLVLLTFWERHCDWMQEENRMKEFSKNFVKILSLPDPNPLAPLAASVLSMFTHHGVSVDVTMATLTARLEGLLSDSNKTQRSLPSGWGQGDGLLSLVLHTLLERENAALSPPLDPQTLLHLTCRIGASLEKTPPDTDFCSVNGASVLLSILLFVFTKDPHSCVTLFADSRSKCVYALGRLLHTDCHRRPPEGTPAGGLGEEDDSGLGSLSALSCQLLCFPFALDLLPETTEQLLQLYDGCGVVAGLLQAIRTLPPSLLELPLSLLSRLLLCDPTRSAPRLRAAASSCGFFPPPAPSSSSADRGPTPEGRTADSLLCALLRCDVLWGSAAELLTLLSRVVRCSPLGGPPASPPPPLPLTPALLRPALAHPDERVRAAACSLLGGWDPFTRGAGRPEPGAAAFFRDMIERLGADPSVPVRRVASRAVGNWLGFMGRAGLTRGRSGSATTGSGDSSPEDGRRRWLEEAKRSAAPLVSLVVSDPDALTRRHCCAALGNLAGVRGPGAASSLLSPEGGDLSRRLLAASRGDVDPAVRRTAMQTLLAFSRQVAT